MAAFPRRRPDHEVKRFRLVRYFTATALAAILVAAAALAYLERRESVYFREVQQQQLAFVSRLHEDFAREQDQNARRNLLLAHESEHVNLTRLMANALWESHLERFLARAATLLDRCHAPSPTPADQPPAAARNCDPGFAKLMIASPEFQALDRRLVETTAGTHIFKIKIFDSRGITVYSSEQAQIGEDKRDNAGWRAASEGRPASELTRRDKFSAFEGVVENRDLISSYVPLSDREGRTVIGVFEIYSDVTALLENIRGASRDIAATAAANQAKLAEQSAANQLEVDRSSYVVVATIAGLLGLLYLALLALARHAQRIIDAQARIEEQAIRREERLHREKMSVLATMAATVGHEIGNPLATITAIADDMAYRQASGEACRCPAEAILEQTRRIAAKTRQMEDFSTARGERAEPTDVNAVVKAVCEFLSFDRRFAASTLEFSPATGLSAPVLAADHLTEAVMALLQSCVEDDDGECVPPRRITVATRAEGDRVVIAITGESGGRPIIRADGPQVEAARRRIAGMGGTLTVAPAACEIALPGDGAELQPAPVDAEAVHH